MGEGLGGQGGPVFDRSQQMSSPNHRSQISVQDEAVGKELVLSM